MPPARPASTLPLFFVTLCASWLQVGAPASMLVAAHAKSVPDRSSIDTTRAQPFVPKPGCVLIAATNDVHGALAPYTRASADGRGAVSEGGVLTLSGYVHNLRQIARGRMLLLDAGDMFQGTMASNLSYGAAMVEAYNALGYDAAAIGNHEFDYGAGDDTSADASLTQVLQARIREANYPFLASNIDDAESMRPISWRNVVPSALKDVGGVSVGIVGATTPTTKNASNPRYVAKLAFAAPAARIVQEAAKLRAQGAQIVVLLAHMGGRCNDRDNAYNIASCKQTGIEQELLDVLGEMPAGTVDVAIGAHTHQFMAHWLGNTAVIESGSQGHYMGLVQACPASTHAAAAATGSAAGTGAGADDAGDEAAGVHRGLDRDRSRIYPTVALCLTNWRDGGCGPRRRGSKAVPARFAGRPVQVMAQVAAKVRPYLEAVDARERASIGAVLPTALSAQRLTQLIAEALRRATGADFGVQNRGGVRTAIAAGATTYKQVFEAVPFDNYATVLTLTGREVVALARALVGERPKELYPAFSGLQIVGRGASLQLVGNKGEALDDERLYTVCTNDFLLNGGDGAGAALAGLDPKRAHTLGLTLRDALVQLLRALYPNPIAAAP